MAVISISVPFLPATQSIYLLPNNTFYRYCRTKNSVSLEFDKFNDDGKEYFVKGNWFCLIKLCSPFIIIHGFCATEKT